MLVFIDDSGDAGFKFNKGSTKYFIIVCVIFRDELEVEKTAVAIKELKTTLKLRETTEFKFNKSDKTIRIQFLECIKKYNFKIRGLIIDKTRIRSIDLKYDKNLFYSYAIKLLLQHSNGSIINAQVRIDGSGDRIFRKSFLTYLRRELNSKQKNVIKNCKLIDSKSNALIQWQT